ncbi:unnamed protein product [Echinostoma caproni]|uniref:Cation_ATPase_N domain-containing protein n=1 Tax=Echinostoma caproni TaxID=27848 RepID=A0A183AR64_9TREM|nr:unnamed protein product [Echinostoma caproni]
MTLHLSLRPPTMALNLVRVMEHTGKTSEALAKLLSLKATEATIVDMGPQFSQKKTGFDEFNWEKSDDRDRLTKCMEKRIPVELVHRGDIIKVCPGEKVPVDSRVICGISACDESLITGESMPVDKQPGSDLIGGSINLTNVIWAKATHVGSDSALAQIVRLVEEAQTSKAPIQQLADRIASYFVPFVCLISLTTFFVWIALGLFRPETVKGYEPGCAIVQLAVDHAFRMAINVLTIASGSILRLIPSRINIHYDSLAQHVGGILSDKDEFAPELRINLLICISAYKFNNALQAIKHVCFVYQTRPLLIQLTTILFDKTGTITQGRPQVNRLVMFIPNDNSPQADRLGSPVTNSNHLKLSTKISPSRLLYLLASAESTVKHPIASAVVNLVRVFRRETDLSESNPLSPNSSDLAAAQPISSAHEYGENPLKSALNAPAFEFAQVCRYC